MYSTNVLQDLAMSWTWSMKFCKLLWKNQINVSCRRLALRMDVSSFTIWRTLHEQGLHPYHLQRVQPEDPPRRIAFCQWLLQ
jgi:hypothetical protein